MQKKIHRIESLSRYKGQELLSVRIDCTISAEVHFRFNHYGTRDKNINKGLYGSDCPRYSNEMNWRYIIQCAQTREFRVDFLVELQIKLEKVIDLRIDKQEIHNMIMILECTLSKERMNGK